MPAPKAIGDGMAQDSWRYIQFLPREDIQTFRLANWACTLFFAVGKCAGLAPAGGNGTYGHWPFAPHYIRGQPARLIPGDLSWAGKALPPGRQQES